MFRHLENHGGVVDGFSTDTASFAPRGPGEEILRYCQLRTYVGIFKVCRSYGIRPNGLMLDTILQNKFAPVPLDNHRGTLYSAVNQINLSI